jgi:hypothetical protein
MEAKASHGAGRDIVVGKVSGLSIRLEERSRVSVVLEVQCWA